MQGKLVQLECLFVVNIGLKQCEVEPLLAGLIHLCLKLLARDINLVGTIMDIGCGFGSFGAHLFHSQLLTMCIVNYEFSGSQFHMTLERGLPAMIAYLTTKKLTYPSISFDMLRCARCGINRDQKGILSIEADNRLLKPMGYFVWTSPITNACNKDNQQRILKQT